MNAKHQVARETLFVRLSAKVKQEVLVSAKQRGTTMSREVERLLEKQLHGELSSPAGAAQLEAKLAASHAQLDAYKASQKMLEMFILSTEEQGISSAANTLHDLRCLVLKLQVSRDKNVEAIQRQGDARQATAEIHDVQRAAGPFGSLAKSSSANQSKKLLQKSEQRRLNLLELLKHLPNGTKAKVAAALGISRSYFSQMLSSQIRNGYRPISDDKARRIEKALSLEAGLLDKLEPNATHAALQQAVLDLEKVVRKIARVRPSSQSPSHKGKAEIQRGE